MTALAANVNTNRMVDQDLREFPVGVYHVYKGGFVGLDPAGMLKPFAPGDELVGLAYEEVDNSAGTAGAKKGRAFVRGDVVCTLTSAADLDSGKPVFALDDSTTIATIGHPDAYVGRILHKHVDASNQVVVRMREPDEKWTASLGGALEYILAGETLTPTGAAGADADVHTAGIIANSALGLGVLNVDGTGGGYDLQFDAVAEIAQASIRTPEVFLASKGATLEGTLHLTDIGDAAALDVDWGLATLVGTASVRKDFDTAEDNALFHMDGASANILAQSDNNTTDVAPVDTTIDNVTTAGAYKSFKVIVRPSGTCEFWIDGVRRLAATAFAVRTTARLGAIINAEKTSDDTTAVVRILKMRAAGAAAA